MAFTPVESGIGGLMIGLAAATAYMVDGKITGISGTVGPVVRRICTCEQFSDDQQWKLLFLLGLVLSGICGLLGNRDHSFPDAMDFSPLRYGLAGMAVGFGTRTGKGCTSGHGICGLPRFSLRSWIAVPTFMGVAMGTVAFTRHITEIDPKSPWGLVGAESDISWEFPAGSFAVSLALAAGCYFLPSKIRLYFAPLACGIMFGLGLCCSGMTSQAKVLDFLDLAGSWDLSLALVMGCGLAVSFPAMHWGGKEGKQPLNQQCKFESPPKYGGYGQLLLGSSFFGLGWGLIGICPGPGLVGLIPYAAQGWGPGMSFGLCVIMMVATWVGTDRALAWMGIEGNATMKEDAQTTQVEPIETCPGSE